MKPAPSRIPRPKDRLPKPHPAATARHRSAKPSSGPSRTHALELLRKATEIPGLSGHESELAAWFEGHARALGAETRRDKLGSCVALLRARPGAASPGPEPRRLLLAAHADSIGLIVTEITSEGFVRVAPLGGVDARLLPAQDVWVHGVRTMPGVFGSIPPHFQSPKDQKKPYEFDELFIDVGLPAAQARRQVRVGDLVSFRAPLVELQGGRISGRALDNRASVVALLLTLERLARWNHTFDVYAVATAQEEFGRACVGALTATFAVQPHVALAMDVTHAEMPGVDVPEGYKMDGGPVLCLGPNAHPGVFRTLVESAGAERMAYQVEPTVAGSGTDAVDIQTVGEGVPTGVVSIPVRYMHSAVETLCLADLERVARLVARFAVRIERGFARPED